MSIGKNLLVGILTLSPLVTHGTVNRQNVEGNWACDPYVMTNKVMTMTVTEYRIYDRSGAYEELGTSVINAANGLTLTTKSTLSGSWSVAGDTLSLRFTSGRFLDSSNTNYTIAMGQAALDEGLKIKSWSNSKVLESRKRRLVITPIKPMYKEAQVVVSCTRT